MACLGCFPHRPKVIFPFEQPILSFRESFRQKWNAIIDDIEVSVISNLKKQGCTQKHLCRRCFLKLGDTKGLSESIDIITHEKEGN